MFIGLIVIIIIVITIGLIVSTVASKEQVMGLSSGVGPTICIKFIYQKLIYEIYEKIQYKIQSILI